MVASTEPAKENEYGQGYSNTYIDPVKEGKMMRKFDVCQLVGILSEAY